VHDRQVQRRQSKGDRLLPRVHRVVVEAMAAPVHVRARSGMDIWTATSMSSHSVSTAANQHRAGNYSIDSLSRPSKIDRLLLFRGLTTTPGAWLRHVNRSIGR